jgi:hypothetical protein
VTPLRDTISFYVSRVQENPDLFNNSHKIKHIGELSANGGSCRGERRHEQNQRQDELLAGDHSQENMAAMLDDITK